MKNGLLRLLLTAVALVSVLSAQTAAAQDTAAPAEEAPAEEAYEYDYAADTDPSAVNDFEDRLEPYGTWVYDDNYGYVWVPDTVVVGRNFAPYRTAGHWAVLDDGNWVWVSDYDWGYIPFHYGRWVWISGRGWSWIPGRVYAPAWVVWRVGEPGYAYVGWAPAPPTYIWVNGVAVGFYYTVTVPWWYCPSAYFFSPYWHVHIVHDSTHVHHIHSHTHAYHHHHARQGATASRQRTGAQASASPSGGTTKSGSGKYTITRIPRSPSAELAQIPKNSLPKQRVKPDSRAMQMRRPTAQLRDSSLKAKRAIGNKGVGTAGRDFRGGNARSRS
ncbi:MAG TPA: DUF6600 domain-containing protein, partial [Polyangiaceae bacterium]|nr:DUF6600 domain-containing protein [Polyangiaceae bacterium]